ncbi:MAG: hypothetical protein IDH49_07770 [Gammaproteobacteria bacterium]|nr:hypothetical protein [Gammaproteobacteria bacterium]
MNTKILARAITAALAVPVIVACGGGGGDPATGSGPTTATRGVSQGPITGFGSVFVNGVEIEIPSGSHIEVEGERKNERDLRIGMVVKIEWEKDASGRPAAKSVKYSDDVQGPLRNIDPAAGTFTVLGQSVIVDRLTKFELDDSSTPISGLTALKNGDIVEVSGLRDANGAIRATRVEVKTGTSASSEFELKGIVSDFNDITKTFMIGATSVSYVTANQVPNVAWGNTACAEVKGSLVGDTLVAAKIKLDDSCSLSGGGSISSDAEVEVEGYVSGLNGSEFKVNGQAVRVTSTTRYRMGDQPADASMIKNDVRVEAEGFIGSDGVLVAQKVSFKLGSDDHSKGGDDSSSPYKETKGKVSFKGNGTVTITNSTGEIIITVNSSTILEDGIKLDLSNLSTGQGVEVYYREQEGKRIAIRIKREDSVF